MAVLFPQPLTHSPVAAWGPASHMSDTCSGHTVHSAPQPQAASQRPSQAPAIGSARLQLTGLELALLSEGCLISVRGNSGFLSTQRAGILLR